VPYIQQGNSDNFLSTALTSISTSAAPTLQASGTVSQSTLSAAAGYIATLGSADGTGYDVLAQLQALVVRGNALLPQLPTTRQGFYTSHTMLQLNMHTAGVSALLQLTAALRAAANKNFSGALSSATQALASCDDIMAALRAGEMASSPGKWRGIYAGDHLTDMQRARSAVRSFLSAVTFPAQPSVPLPLVPGSRWYDFDTVWQKTPAIAASYPLVHPSYSESFIWLVRINCDWTDIGTGACNPNADGGWWRAGSGARVTLQVLDSQTLSDARSEMFDGLNDAWAIHYTTDGTPPTPASPAYVPGSPINLDTVGSAGEVYITAAAFDSNTGTQLGGEKQTTWIAQ
jgi:hypothetical protein